MCRRLDGPCVWGAGSEACCGRADGEHTSSDDEVKWQGCKRGSVVTGRPVSPRSWAASWALTRLTCEACMHFLHACLDFGSRPTVIFVKCSEHERALLPKTRMTCARGGERRGRQRFLSKDKEAKNSKALVLLWAVSTKSPCQKWTTFGYLTDD